MSTWRRLLLFPATPGIAAGTPLLSRSKKQSKRPAERGEVSGLKTIPCRLGRSGKAPNLLEVEGRSILQAPFFSS
jgi:hypothetical protein